MSEENIGDIRVSFGREQTRIVHEYGDLVDRVAQRGSESVENREYMPYANVEKILLDSKEAELKAAVPEYRAQLREAYDDYVERLNERADYVKSELFGGIEDSGALARAALATKEELEELMDMAAMTGNRELARIAFVAGERKGHGEIVHRFLTEVDPNARSLYEEFLSIPSEEQLARQRQNLDRLIAAPDRDRLIPRPKAGSYR